MSQVIDEALLREVVARIELSPETWDQSAWINHSPCGTTFCLAGHTLLAAGYIEEDLWWFDDRPPAQVEPYNLIPRIAAKLLGLSGYQAVQLFEYAGEWRFDAARSRWTSDTVTLDDLKKKITEVTGIPFKVKELHPDE